MNFYLRTKACDHCGRGDEPLHIGKSSWGWCFGLHVIPERGLNSLDDWKREWSKEGVLIEDEEGCVLTPEEMVYRIVDRKGKCKWTRSPGGYRTWDEFHDRNHSEPGPRGLLRHRIGRYCVGHGRGTWDLIPGDFS